jgi:hypothetical protein
VQRTYTLRRGCSVNLSSSGRDRFAARPPRRALSVLSVASVAS